MCGNFHALMKEVIRSPLLLALCVFTFCAAIPARASTDANLSAPEIIQKAVDRAKNTEKQNTPEYALVQKTITEERDEKGEVKDRNEKAEEVRFRSGSLVKPVSQRITKKSTSDKLNLKNSSRSDFIDLLTPELISKYNFTLSGRTNLNGRDAFELCFQPRSKNLPGKQLSEKIMNQACGRLWIDTEEFELVRANVRVDSEVPVAGFLGALKRAAFSLERIRLETGLWLERFYKTDYESRKLTQCKRVITQSEFSNFRKVG